MTTHRRIMLSALLLAATCFASPAGALGLEMGLKAGVNLARFRDISLSAEVKNRTGYVVGPFLALGVGGGLAVQGEALFSVEGSELRTAQGAYGNPPGSYTRIELSYVDVPALLRWTLLPGPVKPFVYGGPSFGLNLSGKSKTPGSPDRDLKNDLKPVDVRAAVGGGLRLDLLGLKLLGDVRYTTSLTNIYDTSSGIKTYNSVWTAAAGIVF